MCTNYMSYNYILSITFVYVFASDTHKDKGDPWYAIINWIQEFEQSRYCVCALKRLTPKGALCMSKTRLNYQSDQCHGVALIIS